MFNLASQSNPFLSRRFRSYVALAATLSLPCYVMAQPADSEIVSTQGRLGIPDPQPITYEELKTLIGGPTLLTFSGTTIPVKDAVQVLLDAAKLPPSLPTFFQQIDNPRTVSLNWKDKSFWDAAREIEQQADGKWDTSFGPGLYLRPNQRQPGQSAEPGLNGLIGAQTPLVTLYATSVSRTGSSKVLLGENQGQVEASPDNTNLALSAYFDPKLDVRSTELRQLKFQSQQNGPVVDGRQIYGLNYGRNTAPISKQNIPIPAAVIKEKKLFRISGVFHSVITSFAETWKIPDVFAVEKSTRTIGAGKYTVERAVMTNDQITINTIAETPRELGIRAVTNPTVYLRDSKGRALRSSGGSSNGGNDKMQSEYRFNLRGFQNEPFTGPFSFEWVIPTQQRSYDVPFEFRDVPLP